VLSTQSTSNLTAGLVATDGTTLQYDPVPPHVVYKTSTLSSPTMTFYTDSNLYINWWRVAPTTLGAVSTNDYAQGTGFPLTFTPLSGQSLRGATNGGIVTLASNVKVSMLPSTNTDPSTISAARNDIQIAYVNCNITMQTGTVVTVPTAGESLVFFQMNLLNSAAAGNQTLNTLSTFNMTALFKSSSLPSLTSTTALLFTLNDSQTGLPLVFLKLYPAGYFTTPTPSVQTNLNLEGSYLTFLGTIETSTPIPQTTEMRQKMTMGRKLASQT